MINDFVDIDLGVVLVKENAQARRVIARRVGDNIQLTVPKYISHKQFEEAWLQLKPRISAIKSKPQFILDSTTTLQTISFSLKIETLDVRNMHASLKNGQLLIICPNTLHIEEPKVQNILRNVVELNLRNEAKRIFPERLSLLAQKYNFSYNKLSINKSKSRWGSCSSQKNINLSYFCMFLPEYLLDFVILHELCHTIEMNHGERFWKILDKVTDNKARLLTTELKKVFVPW